MYPHLWSWDSAFIAIGGKSRYNWTEAEQELISLFSEQWRNGLVPHIIYHRSSNLYIPDPEFWRTDLNPKTPMKPSTSGIVQQPVHATGTLHIFHNAGNQEEARNFLKRIFPKRKAWSEYLYRERDPFDEALVYIHHPWESGQDNSPIRDTVLKKWAPLPHDIPAYRQVDDKIVNSDERPTDIDYDRYVYLIEIFRKNRYDEKQIGKKCPFLIQEVLFNTLLCQTNQDLAKIARVIGQESDQFEVWAKQTKKLLLRNYGMKKILFISITIFDLDKLLRCRWRLNSFFYSPGFHLQTRRKG